MNGAARPAVAKAVNLAQLIWNNAEIMRGLYKPADYGKVVLPFTVLRRLDCVLEPTKQRVLELAASLHEIGGADDLRLRKAAKQQFYNTSKFDFSNLLAVPKNLAANLENYVGGFSENVRDIFERYDLTNHVVKLNKGNLLYLVVQQFANVDLHPDVVSNDAMGGLFENLIRRFAEQSNETAGEHYTPRDAIRLMVDLLLAGDDDLLQNPSPLRTVYDPTAGTGGMLTIAEDHIRALNAKAKVIVFGQELNPESYAICKGDMLVKGHSVENIAVGNTLDADAFPTNKFDFVLSNPPYGVEWKNVQKAVEDEHETKGMDGRFGPGLPRISDGQTLFLMHVISKMRPVAQGGGRAAIVMNGSPLFSGGAGSGESEIRRWVLESDLLEALVALPNDMFYNTGIATYVWILTNRKAEERKGKVQLINAIEFYQKMRRSLGSKRRELGNDDVARIVKIHGAFEEGEHSKIMRYEEFGYRTIVIERPLRLNFQACAERIARLDYEKSLAENGPGLVGLKQALSMIGATTVFASRRPFLEALDAALGNANVSLRPAQYKAVWLALSERNAAADICTGSKDKSEPDSNLRETENVPLDEDVDVYFNREVKPYAADAWIDHDKTRIGYEIPFTRLFYKYEPPRQLHQIDADLTAITSQILGMLNEISA
jgi:type I restriction enzyme M protein